MHTAILTAALLIGGTPPTAADTTVPVERGVRLDVDNFRGDVVIRSWDRDAVRVQARFSGRQLLELVRSGSVLRVRPGTTGSPRDASFHIHIPRWMALRVEGNQVDVDVAGAAADVHVETVGGDVVVDGGNGMVSVRSIQGEITLRNASGRIEAVGVNEDITLTDIDGDLYVETTNGDVILRRIRSNSTRATTVNGDVVYDGTIGEAGRYVFSTHNGDILMTVPTDASATVSVATYHGEFEAGFPVRLTGTTRDRQFTFTLGAGSARIELESFNGEILLERPR